MNLKTKVESCNCKFQLPFWRIKYLQQNCLAKESCPHELQRDPTLKLCFISEVVVRRFEILSSTKENKSLKDWSFCGQKIMSSLHERGLYSDIKWPNVVSFLDLWSAVWVSHTISTILYQYQIASLKSSMKANWPKLFMNLWIVCRLSWNFAMDIVL